MKRTPPADRGFTLVEVAVVCAISVLLFSLAWPSYRDKLLRAGRADGIQALQLMQAAQVKHHALHGLYATDVRALAGVPQPLSAQGRYTVSLDGVDAEGWRGSATPVATGPQGPDKDCPRLTVASRMGFISLGPTQRCWQP